jgi:hypothetical protein
MAKPSSEDLLKAWLRTHNSLAEVTYTNNVGRWVRTERTSEHVCKLCDDTFDHLGGVSEGPKAPAESV